MRASGDTHVISVNTSAAPPSARAPRCTRWKSLGMPSTALYMSIGDTTIRLLRVRLRRRYEVNMGGVEPTTDFTDAGDVGITDGDVGRMTDWELASCPSCPSW